MNEAKRIKMWETPKSTPPAAKKPVSKETQEKLSKETKEPVKQPKVTDKIWHVSIKCSQQEGGERNVDSSQADMFSSRVSPPLLH